MNDSVAGETGEGMSILRRMVRRARRVLTPAVPRPARDLAAELNTEHDAELSGIAEMGSREWETFVRQAQEWSARMDASAWAQVEVRKKVLLALSAAGDRELAVAFLEHDGWEREHFAGTIQDGVVTADVPFASVLREKLGAHMLEFSASELFMDAVLRTVTVTDRGVVCHVFAHINHVRIDVEDLRLSAVLVDAAGTETPVRVERTHDPRAAVGYTRRYADMAAGAARLHIGAEQLRAAGEYRLLLSIEVNGLVRTHALTIDTATVLSIAAPLGDAYVAIEGSGGQPARLQVLQPAHEIAQITLTGRDVEVRSEQRAGAATFIPERAELMRRRAPHDTVASAVVSQAQPSGAWHTVLRLPDTGDCDAHEYVIVFVDDAGRRGFPVLGGAAGATTAQVHVTSSLHRWNEPAGQTLVVDLGRSVLVTDVSVTSTGLLFTTSDPGPGDWVAQAGTARTVLERIPDTSEGTLAFPVREDRWGLGTTAIRPGRYSLHNGERGAYLAGEMAARFPLTFAHEDCNVTVTRGADGQVIVSITAPYRAEEIGAGPQLRLQEWSHTLRPNTSGPRSILFRNLFGEHANDSALAVHRELGRRGSALERIWCVKDHSVWTPEGARRVLEGSREYYEAFGTAHYVMVNMHQPRWHHKPAGQCIIQTFHGYQFKLQGRRWFAALGHDARRTESLFRRADEWDYLVSPAASSTGPLRESYRSDEAIPSEILELGYPRNDALFGDAAENTRREVRERLGIPAGKHAILYAPTFRDGSSDDDMTAELVAHLDLDRLLERLGPNYVLLLRGHPFNARAGVATSSAVLNVTDYPDVNHLILASDLAVLDYSSLRFDYALTGKPMLFFVPDREEYFATRQSFWPYSETAPGPLLRTESELVTQIAQAPAVATEYREARERFIAEYMEHEDGHATERLVEAVFVPRGDAPATGSTPESASGGHGIE